MEVRQPQTNVIAIPCSVLLVLPLITFLSEAGEPCGYSIVIVSFVEYLPRDQVVSWVLRSDVKVASTESEFVYCRGDSAVPFELTKVSED